MRATGQVLLHRPRFTLGLSLGASVRIETHPREREPTSLAHQAKIVSDRVTVGTKPWHRFCLCLVGFLFSLTQAPAQSLDPTRPTSQYGHTVWRTQQAGASGPDPSRPIKQMRHGSWNEASGLTGVVYSLAQTADGFLWIGTSTGL